MRLYLSGPMTGIQDFNYPAFERAANALRWAGYEVVSPHELDGDAGVDLTKPFTQEDRIAALKRDAVAVLDSDGVAILSGWHTSSGAKAEIALADAVGIPVVAVNGWIANSRSVA